MEKFQSQGSYKILIKKRECMLMPQKRRYWQKYQCHSRELIET